MIFLIAVILIIFSVALLTVWILFFKFSQSDLKLFRGGEKAFENKNYKKAKKIFSKLDNLEAKLKLAESYVNLGEADEAQKCYEEIIRTNPKKIEPIIAFAQMNIQQKNYDKAIELLSNGLEFDPNNLICNIELSKVLYAQEKFEQALETLNKIKGIYPNNSEIEFLLIKNNSRLKNPDSDEDCKQILDDYLNIETQKDLPSDFNIELAKAYAKNGEIDKAYSQCQKSLQKTIDNLETYQLLGLIYLLKNDYENAKSNLTTALNIEQSNKETHNIFSYVLCQNVTSCTLPQCRDRYFKLTQKYLKSK